MVPLRSLSPNIKTQEHFRTGHIMRFLLFTQFQMLTSKLRAAMQQNALVQIYLFDLNSNAAFKLNKLNELHCTPVWLEPEEESIRALTREIFQHS